MHEMPYKLPTHFAGKRIKFRVPYTMPGELLVANAGQAIEFPEGTFLHATELPFEIWDIVPHATQVDANGIPLAPPAPGIDKFWRLRLQDIAKNQIITKNAQLVDTLVDRNAGIWFWRVPYTVVRAEGFQVAVDNLLPAAPGLRLRAEVTFRGFLIVLEAPSETR
jgi:hypothetical protein